MEQKKKADAAAGAINIGGGQVHVGGDIVGGNKTIYEAPPVSVPALHQLRPPPRDFTGREKEIAELMAAVAKGGVTISGLQGLGGVGKTALALKLAERLTPSYPDAQFDLDLKGVSTNPLTSKQAMEHVIRAHHPTAKLPENETELAGLYQSVLHGKRAILLMDNARDAKQIAPLIPPPSCLLLVTSRQRFALPGLLEKNLDALPPADARDLLLAIARRLATEKVDYAGELVRLCAYLPLAIRSVGSALAARSDLKPADYVRKLSDAHERLKLTETDASLSLSYDLLPDELKQKFVTLAVFPDTFDAAGAAAVWDVDEDTAQDSLSELCAYSLVEFHSVTGRYRLHDLVHVFADACLVSSERAASQRRHAAHYRDVLDKADTLYRQGKESPKEGLFLFDTEWANIQAGQAWAAGQAREDEAAALCSDYPFVGRICLTLRRHPRERIAWLTTARAAAGYLEDRCLEGWHLNGLGDAYKFLGEYRRAIEYHEKHLEIAREIADRQGEGIALGNLGVAYYFLGEYRRAIEYHEKHLEIAREMADRRSEGNALGNLGLAHNSLGEYRRAIECHEQCLQIAREIGNRLGEGQSLCNLGISYDYLGEYHDAIEFHEQYLQIAREIGDRHAEGGALGNLGTVYAHLAEYHRAIEFHEQHLRISRDIGDQRGEEHALGSLGVAYDCLCEYRRAIEFHKQQLRIARDIGDRSGEGGALGNLGISYDSLGEYRRAIEYYEQSLQIAREIGDRLGEGETLWNMSLAFDTLSERAKAIAHAEEARKIYEQIESPYAASVRKTLARWRGEG